MRRASWPRSSQTSLRRASGWSPPGARRPPTSAAPSMISARPRPSREQAGDLARGDQIAKAAGAVARLDDVEQHAAGGPASGSRPTFAGSSSRRSAASTGAAGGSRPSARSSALSLMQRGADLVGAREPRLQAAVGELRRRSGARPRPAWSACERPRRTVPPRRSISARRDPVGQRGETADDGDGLGRRARSSARSGRLAASSPCAASCPRRRPPACGRCRRSPRPCRRPPCAACSRPAAWLLERAL